MKKKGKEKLVSLKCEKDKNKRKQEFNKQLFVGSQLLIGYKKTLGSKLIFVINMRLLTNLNL